MSANLQVTLVLISTISLILTLPFLIPLKLLRLLPIISSTISLQFAYDEYAFFSCWMDPSYTAQANTLLPPWFKNWGPWGTNVVLGSFTLSLASGMANFLTGKEVPEAVVGRYWYAAGFIFAVAHLLVFGQKALKLLAMIRGGEPGGESTVLMGKWLEMHSLRSFAVDLPAMVCFVVATLSVMDVVV
jgi:hypothetical protein